MESLHYKEISSLHIDDFDSYFKTNYPEYSIRSSKRSVCKFFFKKYNSSGVEAHLLNCKYFSSDKESSKLKVESCLVYKKAIILRKNSSVPSIIVINATEEFKLFEPIKIIFLIIFVIFWLFIFIHLF
jgi:hypothetical protein